MTSTTPTGSCRRVPRFRRHLRVETATDTVYVFDEHGVTTLSGAPVAALAPYLDGTHDLEVLRGARPGGLDATGVTGLVERLEQAGLVAVETVTPAAPDATLAWWDACGLGAETARTSGRTRVRVLSEHARIEPLCTALRDAGLAVTTDDDDPVDLDLVICADYLDPRLGPIDRARRESGTPWLLVKADGVRAWIGPVFGSAGTGCWKCLAHRLWAHRGAEATVQAELGHDGPARRTAVATPPVTGMLAHLAALEASKWAAGLRYEGQRCVWTFDTTDLSGRRHEVRPRPQCSSCGDPGLVTRAMRRPIHLSPAARIEGLTGDRTRRAEETLAAYRHLVSPVTGIVKQVTPDPRVPAFAHAYRSGANIAWTGSSLSALRRGLRSENGGKGFTALDAEVGALCEAAERHSGTRQGDEPRTRGSLRSLGHDAVDPRTCLLFDERQYAERATWNPRHSPFNHVPEPFDPDGLMDWTPLWSLGTGRARLLPTAMLFFGGPRERSLPADSNGCAAGSSLEDAILQGALELVERDAAAQWWYNRLSAPGIALDATADPRLADQRAHHRAIGRELWALEITSDLGVPVVVALSRCVDRPDDRILIGFGAHLDPATAVRRAVAEVNQMLQADHGIPDDPDWVAWAGQLLDDHPHLRPSPDRSVRTVPEMEAEARVGDRSDIRDDVEDLVERFERHGMETLVLDQTRPDVGLPVVRVVVPGMRAFWARFAPGRLLDAPVSDGRLARPTSYEQLNPLPLFL